MRYRRRQAGTKGRHAYDLNNSSHNDILHSLPFVKILFNHLTSTFVSISNQLALSNDSSCISMPLWHGFGSRRAHIFTLNRITSLQESVSIGDPLLAWLIFIKDLKVMCAIEDNVFTVFSFHLIFNMHENDKCLAFEH